MYEYLQYGLLHLHRYTGGMLKGWPMHNMILDLISQLTGYLCACSIYTVYIILSSSKLTIITADVCKCVCMYVSMHGWMCCRSEYKYHRNEYIPSSYGILHFGGKIPSLLLF